MELSDRVVFLLFPGYSRSGHEVEKRKLYDVVEMIESLEHTNPMVSRCPQSINDPSVKSLFLSSG